MEKKSVMPKKKKCKPSGFSTFMWEFIDKQRAAGRRINKKDYSKVAAPHWEKLSLPEREKYNRRAKELPAKSDVKQCELYTTQGLPISKLEEIERAKEERQRDVVKNIRLMVENAFLNGEINTKVFHFIMANYFYVTSDNPKVYVPAEIAMIKFSFESGASSALHEYLNPQVIAMGYAFTAKSHSESCHHLPVPPNAMGHTDFESVYNKILDFIGIKKVAISNDGDIPCIFTLDEHIPMINSILEQLSHEHNNEIVDVLPLKRLFFQLKETACKFGRGGNEAQPLVQNVSNMFLEIDRYDCTPNIACAFHEEEDVAKHCALSYVRRWSYEFADHICSELAIELVPGKHLPQNADISFQQVDELSDGSFWDQTESTSETRTESGKQPRHRFARKNPFAPESDRNNDADESGLSDPWQQVPTRKDRDQKNRQFRYFDK